MRKKLLAVLLALGLFIMWLGAGFAQSLPDNETAQLKYQNRVRQINASPYLGAEQKRVIQLKLKRQMVREQALRRYRLNAQKATPEGNSAP